MAGNHLPPSQTLTSIIDSGANDHMIGKHLAVHHPDFVTTFTVGSVKFPNGHITKAAKL